MTFLGWLEIAIVLGVVLITAWPLGIYMARVFEGEQTNVSAVHGPIRTLALFHGRHQERP